SGVVVAAVVLRVRVEREARQRHLARLGAHDHVARIVALGLQIVVQLVLVVQHVADLRGALFGLLEVRQLPGDHFPAVGALDGYDVTHVKPFHCAAAAAGPKCSRWTLELNHGDSRTRTKAGLFGPIRGMSGSCAGRIARRGVRPEYVRYSRLSGPKVA